MTVHATQSPHRKKIFSAERSSVLAPGSPDREQGRRMQIAVVTGNPKPASRTYGVALALADLLATELSRPEPARPEPAASAGAAPVAAQNPTAHLVIDLAEHASSLFDWSDAELSRLTAEVAAADVAIFASPTYKAAYTGMLKAFLDRYGSNGLAGTVAVPVMTGGWPGHLLAVEVHLRPVLVELGATVPARGLYVTEPEFANLDAAVAKWAQTAIPLIRRALPLA
jgi:FMN reductase